MVREWSKSHAKRLAATSLVMICRKCTDDTNLPPEKLPLSSNETIDEATPE